MAVLDELTTFARGSKRKATARVYHGGAPRPERLDITDVRSKDSCSRFLAPAFCTPNPESYEYEETNCSTGSPAYDGSNA